MALGDKSANEYHRDIRRDRLEAARKKGRHTALQWAKLLVASDGVCPRCLSDEWNITKDHIIPLYAGGSDGADNIQPLCCRCNAAKDDFKDWMAIRGWRPENL